MSARSKRRCIALVSRSRVGFRCNQHLADFGVTFPGRNNQGCVFADRTGNEKRISQIKYNQKSAAYFETMCKVGAVPAVAGVDVCFR
jgi:hypothetical protein